MASGSVPSGRDPLDLGRRDIPSQEQILAALQAELLREAGPFRVAFEHAAIGMAIVALNGSFLRVNRSLCQIVGYTEAEMLTTSFQAITHPDDLDPDLQLVVQVLEGEIDHYTMEKRYFHKQGPIVWVLLSVAIVRDEQRRPLYFVAQITDITDRKRAEQESARRLRQFERLTRTVSRILRTFDCEDGDSVYPAVLATLLETCQSDSGVFLRLSDPQALVGSFVSPSRRQEVRYALPTWNELWQQALHAGVVIVDNQTHWTVCDTVLERSLVAPLHYDGTPLGVMHLGNSPHDYDDDDRDLISHVSDLIAPALRARLRREQLTPREAEVMDLIVAGKTQKQIAAELNITVQTAAKHRARVLQKLSVSNDVELVHLAQNMKPAWPVVSDPQPPSGDGSP